MLRRFFNQPYDYTAQFAARRKTYSRLSLDDHFDSETPKRILALDGGGTRAAITIAVLERIEKLLRQRHGNHGGFRLADYYDMVGGSSTGAIIAALLACKSLSMADIRSVFLDLTRHVYRRQSLSFLQSGPRTNFDGKNLQRFLDSVFGDITLGDDQLCTGLAVIARRVDTDSTWVMHNNPDGEFFENPADKSYVGNRHYPLANILRASTAAPYDYAPEEVSLFRGPAGRESGLFVDSSFTPHNNPALQMFLLTTLKGKGFEWHTGPDNLLVTSVGTGSLCATIGKAHARRMRNGPQTHDVLSAMMDEAGHMGEMMMQLMSEPDEPQWIDKNIGDLRDHCVTDGPQFSYQRFQPKLQAGVIREQLGLALTPKQMQKVRSMTDADGFQIAYEIGQAVAERMIKEDHFPASFDLTTPTLEKVKIKQPAAEIAAQPTAETDIAQDGAPIASMMLGRHQGPLAPSARRHRR